MRPGGEADGPRLDLLGPAGVDRCDLEVDDGRDVEPEMDRRAVAEAVAVRRDRREQAIVPGKGPAAVRQGDVRDHCIRRIRCGRCERRGE